MSSTLGRSLAILDLFSPASPVWTADAIAARLGCSRPTGYRYVRELVATGLLHRVGAGLYSLGPRIVELDYLIRQTDPVLTCGLPVVRELVASTGCEALLVEPSGEQILTTHHEQGIERLRLLFGRGQRLPVVRGAPSRIILAHQPTRRLRRVYAEHRAEVAKAKLGRTFEEFRRGLAALRRAGFARSQGEIDPGFTGFAAPVLGSDGTVLGAVVIALSDRRLATTDEAVLVRLLTDAARTISTALAPLGADGFRPAAPAGPRTARAKAQRAPSRRPPSFPVTRT